MGQPGNASFQALMGTGYMTFLGQFQLFKKKKTPDSKEIRRTFKNNPTSGNILVNLNKLESTEKGSGSGVECLLGTCKPKVPPLVLRKHCKVNH